MILAVDDLSLEFIPVMLEFGAALATDVFALKNNRTLAETIAHPKYRHLAEEATEQYPAALGQPVGQFLYELKQKGDPFYKKFLNKYGDAVFCAFAIREAQYLKLKGLYSWVVAGEVKYIGQSVDTFGKRVNTGYGQIHPVNCFLHGQATNCHLNALIAAHRSEIEFYLCPLASNTDISRYEKLLIQRLQPEWNIALKRV